MCLPMCVCVCMYVQVDAGVYYNMCVEARGHPGVSVFTILPYLRQDLLFTAVYPRLASGDSPIPVYPRLASGDSPVPVSHLHTGIAYTLLWPHFYIDSGYPTCVTRTLPTEQSLHPTSFTLNHLDYLYYCINYLSCCCDKNLYQKWLRRAGLFWLSGSLLWRERRVAGTWGSWWHHILSQEAEKIVGARLTYALKHSGTPARGTALPSFRVCLPFSISLI